MAGDTKFHMCATMCTNNHDQVILVYICPLVSFDLEVNRVQHKKPKQTYFRSETIWGDLGAGFTD